MPHYFSCCAAELLYGGCRRTWMPKSGSMLTSFWSVRCCVLEFSHTTMLYHAWKYLRSVFTKLLLSYLRNNGPWCLACWWLLSKLSIVNLDFHSVVLAFVFRICLVWCLPRSNRKSPRKRKRNSQSHTRKPPAYCSAVMRRYWRARLDWNGLRGFSTSQNKELFRQELQSDCCVFLPCLPHSCDMFTVEEAYSWLRLTQDLGNRNYVEVNQYFSG